MPRGLEELAEAAEAALRGEFGEVVERCAAARSAAAETLLDLRAVELPGLVEEYLRVYREGVSLVADALVAGGVLGGGEAGLAAELLCLPGGAGDGCVLVRARRGFETPGGRLVARGGLVCLEPLVAVRLAAAGVVEPLGLLGGGDSI